MWESLVNPAFNTKTLQPGADKDLYTLQCVFMSTVLEKVFMNTQGLKLVRLYEIDPKTIWRKHKGHQTSSSSSQRIAIVLSNRISNMTIATSKSRSDFLEEFDKTLTKFDKVSADKMPESQKIGLLRRAVNANEQLLQAWSTVETIIANGNKAGTPISYHTYMDYLVQHSDMLDEGALNNTTLKANKSQSNYMESYEPQDSYFDDATDLSAYMGEQTDVDELQHTLLCNQAMREGKPRPPRKLRRERLPIRPELQIKGPLWSDISPELRTAWARESTENKEKVIAQFKVPVVKNSQLAAYRSDTLSAGYESDITENTHNSEHTYVSQA